MNTGLLPTQRKFDEFSGQETVKTPSRAAPSAVSNGSPSVSQPPVPKLPEDTPKKVIATPKRPTAIKPRMLEKGPPAQIPKQLRSYNNPGLKEAEVKLDGPRQTRSGLKR